MTTTAPTSSPPPPPSTDGRPLVYVGFAADIVHHGHINIVRVASSLGRVMVGLLTDDAILSYKRETIINWDNRRTVVAGIQGVDEVVPQTTHDYADNLRTYRPKYVVHGSDWREGVQAKVRQRVIDLLATWGGELVEPEYTPDVSTTDIITKCHDYERKRRQGELPSAALQEKSVTDIISSIPVTLTAELPRLRPIAYVGVSTDFLHHGHIHIISEAAKLGNVIVGILTDDAVASYKGKSVVPYNHRVTIFQNLKGVTRVVPQTSLSYTANLDLFKPEFVVHGDNWRTDVQRPVRDAVIAQLSTWGGRLIEPAYTRGADSNSPPTSRSSSTADLTAMVVATSSSDSSPATSPIPSLTTATDAPSSVEDMIAARCFQRVEDKAAKQAALAAVAVAAAAASPDMAVTPVITAVTA